MIGYLSMVECINLSTLKFIQFQEIELFPHYVHVADDSLQSQHIINEKDLVSLNYEINREE